MSILLKCHGVLFLLGLCELHTVLRGICRAPICTETYSPLKQIPCYIVIGYWDQFYTPHIVHSHALFSIMCMYCHHPSRFVQALLARTLNTHSLFQSHQHTLTPTHTIHTLIYTTHSHSYPHSLPHNRGNASPRCCQRVYGPHAGAVSAARYVLRDKSYVRCKS